MSNDTEEFVKNKTRVKILTYLSNCVHHEVFRVFMTSHEYPNHDSVITYSDT